MPDIGLTSATSGSPRFWWGHMHTGYDAWVNLQKRLAVSSFSKFSLIDMIFTHLGQ